MKYAQDIYFAEGSTACLGARKKESKVYCFVSNATSAANTEHTSPRRIKRFNGVPRSATINKQGNASPTTSNAGPDERHRSH